MVSSFIGLDFTKQENMLLFEWSKVLESTPYCDTSPLGIVSVGSR